MQVGEEMMFLWMMFACGIIFGMAFTMAVYEIVLYRKLK